MAYFCFRCVGVRSALYSGYGKFMFVYLLDIHRSFIAVCVCNTAANITFLLLLRSTLWVLWLPVALKKLLRRLRTLPRPPRCLRTSPLAPQSKWPSPGKQDTLLLFSSFCWSGCLSSSPMSRLLILCVVPKRKNSSLNRKVSVLFAF